MQATPASYPAPQVAPKKALEMHVEQGLGCREMMVPSSQTKCLPLSLPVTTLGEDRSERTGTWTISHKPLQPVSTVGCLPHRRRSAELLLAEQIKTGKHDFHPWTYCTIIAQNF